MPSLIEFSTAKWTAEDRARNAAMFPETHYGDLTSLDRAGFDAFHAALQTDNEEAIHQAFCACPYLLNYVVPTSGNHGTWAFSKQMIRTKRSDGQPGLIPDFLIATRNSGGFTWHIIELKRPKVQFSNAAGDGYSTDGHKGIAQVASYAAHFREYIETVRSNVGIDELITPKNVILIIGDSETESLAQRVCRRNFEEITRDVIVATYSRILRGAAHDLHVEGEELTALLAWAAT